MISFCVFWSIHALYFYFILSVVFLLICEPKERKHIKK